MRVVVVGATGNVGTSVLEALAGEPDVSVLGLARRRPELEQPNVEWAEADVTAPTSSRSSAAPTASSTSPG